MPSRSNSKVTNLCNFTRKANVANIRISLFFFQFHPFKWKWQFEFSYSIRLFIEKRINIKKD